MTSPCFILVDFFFPLRFPLRLDAVLSLCASSIGIAVVVVPSLAGLAFAALDQSMSLQSVFSRKALATKCARERLDGQVDPFMTLQVMVSAEGLNALVALEGPFRLWWRWCVPVHHRVSAIWGN